MFGGILEIDLIGAYAKTTDDDEVLGCLENSCSEPRLGSYPKYMDVSESMESATSTRVHGTCPQYRIRSINSSSDKEDFRVDT